MRKVTITCDSCEQEVTESHQATLYVKNIEGKLDLCDSCYREITSHTGTTNKFLRWLLLAFVRGSARKDSVRTK